MKLALVGSTGQTARHVIQQALERGHEVRIITKDPSRLDDLEHRRLNIIKGDIFTSSDLAVFFIGCHAVISPVDLDTGRVKFFSQSAQSIVAAMRTANISRFICLSSWYVHESREESFIHRWFVRPFVHGRTLDDMAKMEDFLNSSCADIDYTVVRPPTLTDNAYQRATVVCKPSLYVPGVSNEMPRHNVAKYILDILTDTLTYQKMLAIGLIPHHSQPPSPNQAATNNNHVSNK